jgi:hypothetical protein
MRHDREAPMSQSDSRKPNVLRDLLGGLPV